MGKASGSADQSGVAAAEASAQAAQLSYNLGEQQLAWTQQVWNQEQPLINQAEQQDIAVSQAEQVSLQQMQQEAAQQWGLYMQYYAPLEEAYVGQVENWASPENTALVQGQAQAAVAEQTQQGLNTAGEQLRAYGINPGSPEYAGMYIGSNVLGGAAQAAAGTTASQNLKLQQLALEQGAINTGLGVSGQSGSLTSAGTQAGQGSTSAATSSAGTAQSNLSTGAQAMTLPTNWFNTGATNMSVYTNAVNAYNQAQLGYAQVAAEQSLGLGSLVGGLLGDVIKAEKGGPITKFQDAGPVAQAIPTPPNDTSQYPATAHPAYPSPSAELTPESYPQFTQPQTVTPSTPSNPVRDVYGVRGPAFASPGPRPQLSGYASDPRYTSPSGATVQQLWMRPEVPVHAQPGAHGVAARGGGRLAADLRHQGGPIGYAGGGQALPVNPHDGTPNPWSQTRMQGPDLSSVNSARIGTQRPMAMAGAGAIPHEPPPDHGTPGGYVHHNQSPSGGRHVDDVPARLSAGEFVMPLDVVEHLGKQHFYNLIDKSRKQQKAMADRNDVGGETAEGTPQRPTFQSVPAHMHRAIPDPV